MASDGGDFTRSMSIATSGLRAQAGRMRVISENIANADSTAPTAGGDPPSRQSAAAQKNETPNRGKNQRIATASLIRWSIQEVRRIAIRLARKRIQPAHIIAWSLWRRVHQAAAQRAHLKAKKQL